MLFIAVVIAVFLTSSGAYVAIAPDERTLRASRGVLGGLRAGGSAMAETVRTGWGPAAWSWKTERTGPHVESSTGEKTPARTPRKTGSRTPKKTPSKTGSRTPGKGVSKTPARTSSGGSWRTGYRRFRTGVRRTRVLVRAVRTGVRTTITKGREIGAAAVEARRARKAARTPEQEAQITQDRYWWKRPPEDQGMAAGPPSETPAPTGGKTMSDTGGEYTGPGDIQADVDNVARLAEEAAAAQAAAAAAVQAMDDAVAGMVGKYEGGGPACPTTSSLTSSIAGLGEGGGSDPAQVLDLLPAISDAVTEAQGLGENVATIGAEGDTGAFKDS